MSLHCEKTHQCHGGTVSYYVHESVETKTPMRFTVFLPPQANTQKVPYLLFLSGLTCTEDNFTTKANGYKCASALGMAIVVPDTSPRGEKIPNHDDYDLGQGAGFYLDATEAPWVTHFRMESYVINELLPLVESLFSVDPARRSIAGHSMGGHGALTLHLKYPGMFRSCSAFAPIAAPSQVPWGQKAFTAYLGNDQDAWKRHDACALMAQEGEQAKNNAPTLIDQGTDDVFLAAQLKPHLFEEACRAVGQPLTLRMQDGYDHSYFFIQSFIEEHLEWHHQYV